MPIVIPKDLPAYRTLQEENIFVMERARASAQDIRPVEIAIFNLMPTKEITETQLMRLLSNSPLQINLTLIATESYRGTHTDGAHLDRFYHTFSDVKQRRFDGLIVTGAPVERMDFDEVAYWREMTEIFEFAKKNVTSTIFICWGAQAALHYFYGIEKELLPQKLFGVYPHRRTEEYELLLKGLDDVFYMPHSRHTAISSAAIEKEKELVLLAASDRAGAGIIKSKDNRFFFFTGHPEYDRYSLLYEYERDLKRGDPIAPPEHYFSDERTRTVDMCWKSTANLLYVNWLNYYVYQVTPYDLNKTE